MNRIPYNGCQIATIPAQPKWQFHFRTTSHIRNWRDYPATVSFMPLLAWMTWWMTRWGWSWRYWHVTVGWSWRCPTCHGGLGMEEPQSESNLQYQASRKVFDLSTFTSRNTLRKSLTKVKEWWMWRVLCTRFSVQNAQLPVLMKCWKSVWRSTRGWWRTRISIMESLCMSKRLHIPSTGNN